MVFSMGLCTTLQGLLNPTCSSGRTVISAEDLWCQNFFTCLLLQWRDRPFQFRWNLSVRRVDVNCWGRCWGRAVFPNGLGYRAGYRVEADSFKLLERYCILMLHVQMTLAHNLEKVSAQSFSDPCIPSLRTRPFPQWKTTLPLPLPKNLRHTSLPINPDGSLRSWTSVLRKYSGRLDFFEVIPGR